MLSSNGRFLLTLAAILSSVTSLAETSSVDETVVDVFLAVSDHFRSDCLFVVSSAGDLESHVTSLRLIKATSRKGAWASMLNVATLFGARERDGHCLRPLNLLLFDGDDVREQLIQLSRNVRLAGPIWLLFLNSSANLEAMFRGAHVPFDCEFLIAQSSSTNQIVLSEVYRIAKSWPLRSELFGSWSADKRLTAPKGGLYTRRISLQGLTLRATNVHEPPLSTVSTVDGIMHLDGFCGQVWSLLEKRMNFTTVHMIPGEGGNRWEEMMFQLTRGEADCTATYIVHTSERDQLVDFTIPLAIIPLRVFIAEPTGRQVEWSDFLSPFSRSLWLALLVSTLAAAALLALLYHVIRRVAPHVEDAYPLSDAVFLVFGAVFCQQGHAQTPKTLPCRIVHMVTFLVGIIALSAYSGSLISNLTLFSPSLPFDTMEGLYERDEFAFGMPNKSLAHIQTKNASAGILRRLYDRYIDDHPENTPDSNLEGFQRVCATRYTFVGLSESLTLWRDALNCSVTHLPQRFFSFSASLAFQKGSPYRGLFNYNLIRLLNGGVLGLLHKKALDERPSSSDDDVTPINLEAVTPMLSIVVVGICLALVVFILERRTMTSSQAHAARLRVIRMHRRDVVRRNKYTRVKTRRKMLARLPTGLIMPMKKSWLNAK